jgi:hypothetical protein
VYKRQRPLRNSSPSAAPFSKIQILTYYSIDIGGNKYAENEFVAFARVAPF